MNFCVLGMSLRVETNDGRVERVAKQSFGPETTNSADDSALCLRLLVHDVPEVDEWSPAQPVMRGQGDAFYIAASRASVVSGNINTGFAFGFISEREASHEEHLRSTMVQSPVLWMAGNRALSTVHTACVVLDSVAVMIRGVSNAGKTTLAYAALHEGFSLLAEDVAFVFDREDHGLELRGLPWLLYLKPDATRFFPELADQPVVERYNGEHKIAVNVERRFPGQTIQQAEIGPTVFVERRPGATTRLELLDRELARRQLEETRIVLELAENRGIAVWDYLLDQPVYRFQIGGDPRSAARELRRVVEGLS